MHVLCLYAVWRRSTLHYAASVKTQAQEEIRRLLRIQLGVQMHA